MAKKKASSTLYFIFFFIIFLAFCAFAVDGAIVLTNRAKLQNITEATALAAASEFNDTTLNIADDAKKTFNLLKQDSLKAAIIDDPLVDITHRTVIITTHMVSQPFFLAFLGVTGINLNAHANAVSESRTVRATGYSGVNWLTKYKPYMTDIIASDSAILKSLNTNVNKSYDSSSGKVNWDYISSNIGAGQATNSGNYPLSLGPGGFVTIKLPAPIIDKPGPDLSIEETGAALEGYMVFAGLDVDPDKPYSDYTKPNGGELKWVNISCSGTAVNTGYQSVHSTSTNGFGTQDTFYGSGTFDIGSSCYGSNVSMVKYIRIVDDNSESAYINDRGTYYQTMLYGESSTTTPGADIDYVQVLNYVHLQ